MSKSVERYEPRNELEKFGAEAFQESPNTKRLIEILEGQQTIEIEVIVGIAEKSFIDGFMTALRSMGRVPE